MARRRAMPFDQVLEQILLSEQHLFDDQGIWCLFFNRMMDGMAHSPPRAPFQQKVTACVFIFRIEDERAK